MKNFLLLLVLSAGICSSAQEQLNLMPQAAGYKLNGGQLVFQRAFSVSLSGAKDPRLSRAVDRFLQQLRKHTGFVSLDTSMVEHGPATVSIAVEQSGKDVQELGEDESYKLVVSSNGAQLTAPTTLGAIHGLQTLLQLVQTGPEGFFIPAVTINDKPRYPWRGLMIDVSRHFMPVNVLKRNLDGMAFVKMNVFHWHLSDDQGFRVESKKLPKLQAQASDGLFYTQDEVRDVIAYAHDRGIRVVPEFDMPGHSTALFAAYPELASGPGPYHVERRFGIFDPAIDPTQEDTYKFLDKFIGEMAGLFPDKYFHIGGDEVNGKQWAANPKIQEFMAKHNLKTSADLQAYFNERVLKIVQKHGKVMEGWDEVLRPELPKDVVIQSWRGESSLTEVAKLGFHGILSKGYYLDLMYPAAQHYLNDPDAGLENLPSDQKKSILGGEACMWDEFASPETIDSRIWPRTAAIAERFWSPQSVKDVTSMYGRLAVISRELDEFGLTHNTNYEPMLRRMVSGEDTAALRVLADVVEPVKEYAREELAVTPATSLDPLNRLIDAARPESDTAREFATMVDRIIAGAANQQARTEVRALLTLWRDNDAKLRLLEPRSFLMKEVLPLSQDLSSFAAVGLSALDYLEGQNQVPDSWRNAQTPLLQQAAEPQAQLLLMVVDPVRKLADAAARSTASAPR